MTTITTNRTRHSISQIMVMRITPRNRIILDTAVHTAIIMAME